MSKARHYVKMMLLIAAWIFFTIVFMLYNEKEEIKRNTFVGPGEIKGEIIEKVVYCNFIVG